MMNFDIKPHTRMAFLAPICTSLESGESIFSASRKTTSTDGVSEKGRTPSRSFPNFYRKMICQLVAKKG
jgi:hypothetical protein